MMHVVSLAGCLLMIPLSKAASSLLFDPSYYSAWIHIPFLTLSAFFSCLCGFLASAFRAYKKTGQLFVSVSIGAIVNITLNFILIKTVGIVGASIATAASFLVTWAIRMHTIQQLVKVKILLPQTIATYILTITGCADKMDAAAELILSWNTSSQRRTNCVSFCMARMMSAMSITRIKSFLSDIRLRRARCPPELFHICGRWQRSTRCASQASEPSSWDTTSRAFPAYEPRGRSYRSRQSGSGTRRPP